MPELPGFTKKRKILYSSRTTREELIAVGNDFLDEEYFDDALEFFTRADAPEEIEKVAKKVFELGDVPLFLRAKRALKQEITAEECESLAKRAIESGRLSMARLAYTTAGMTEKAEEIMAMQDGGETKEKTQTRTEDSG